MRSALLVLLGLASVALSSAAPSAVCPSLPVQLELRPSDQMTNAYKLVFGAIGGQSEMADFVDIHYRINNDPSENLRVLTAQAITETNQPAKQAYVDSIVLRPGDALRAYATYSSKGFACDTPIHTFSAPEPSMNIAAARPRSSMMVDSTTRPTQSDLRRQQMATRQEENFWANADIDTQSIAAANMQPNQAVGACPSIPIDLDVLKLAGMSNTFVLSFENKMPTNQLHYVDLHLSTDAAQGWDNIRLGSDMQLNMAHKVLQPGVVVKPNETLKFYYSYRTVDQAGSVIDCTTPINAIQPSQVTHEVTMANLAVHQ